MAFEGAHLYTRKMEVKAEFELIESVQKGTLEAVKNFIEPIINDYEFDYLCTTDSLRLCFNLIIADNNVELFKYFLELEERERPEYFTKRLLFDRQNSFYVYFAFRNKDIELVKLLLKKGFKIDFNKITRENLWTHQPSEEILKYIEEINKGENKNEID